MSLPGRRSSFHGSKGRPRLWLVWALLPTFLSLASPRAAEAKESYLVIITGLGGEDSYRERFHEWSLLMRQAAIERFGIDEKRIFYLSEKPEQAPELIQGESTKENILKLFAELRGLVQSGDQLFILLIGHGSYRSEESRFMMPGPDLTAVDFEILLQPFTEQQIVFVNASSASGNFVSALSAPNRIIVTATKTGFERNETQFGKHFVEAYAADGADTDKNNRVSVLEAFNYARLQVDQFYQTENRLKTEHALLDDNGDGEGELEPGPTSDGSDGALAGGAFLLGGASETLSADQLESNPELAGLVVKQRELEGRVETLRQQKDSMPEAIYLEELEKLLVELAETTARIDELQVEPPSR